MYFKTGEIRPYMQNKCVHYGKILAVNENTYTIKDLETKETKIIKQENVFIGDD